MTEAKLHRHRPGPADIACAAGLVLGIIAGYVFLALTPSLLVHHGLVLETFAGTTAAIVSGGAFARVGHGSLLLVAAAPLATILLYDFFYWWAGRLWGTRVAAAYTRNSPRMAAWVERVEGLVRRRGVFALAVAYYLPLPNFIVYVSCGVSEMPLLTFLIGDAIGLLLWEVLLIGLGWSIGHPAVHVVNEVGHYSLWVTVGLVAVVFAYGAVRRRRAIRAVMQQARLRSSARADRSMAAVDAHPPG